MIYTINAIESVNMKPCQTDLPSSLVTGCRNGKREPVCTKFRIAVENGMGGCTIARAMIPLNKKEPPCMIDQAAIAIRVLLIGSHPIVLWGLEKLIDSQRPRMEVVGKFTNCSEVFSQLEQLSPDVILLERELGIENGVDAIPQLTGLSKAKIMVLTGSRDPSAHVSAVLAGAKGVVEKEEAVETILRALEKVHEGQVWLDRASMGRLVIELSNRKVAEKRDPAQQRVGILTDREREIVTVVTSHSGATGTVIAGMLHISESTLRKHLGSIYEKLGLNSRLELWDYAHKRGLNKDSG